VTLLNNRDAEIIKLALSDYGTWRMQKPKRERAKLALERILSRFPEQEVGVERPVTDRENAGVRSLDDPIDPDDRLAASYETEARWQGSCA
jgi:hypothetical protein